MKSYSPLIRRLRLIACGGVTLLAASLARADHIDRMIDGPFEQRGAGNQDAFGSSANILGSIRDVSVNTQSLIGGIRAELRTTHLTLETGVGGSNVTLALGYGLPFGGGSFTADFVGSGAGVWNSIVVRLSNGIGSSGTLSLTVDSGGRQFTFAPQTTPVGTSLSRVDEYTFFYSEDAAKTINFQSIDGVRLSFTTSSQEGLFYFRGIRLGNSAPQPSPSPSPTASPSPSATPPNTSTLLNISTRLRVETGENVLIGGFIVTGNTNKRVILRAIGPSLSSDGAPVAGRLADPTLELFDADNKSIALNDDWRDSPDRGEIENSGVRPGDDREPAIARTLAPGRYTAVVRGQGNSIGIAVVETYDRDNGAGSKLANISTRGFVGTGDNVMIGGFITGNQNGGTKVLVRAIGPSLRSTIGAAMGDPVLQLKDQNGQTLRANDNWKDDQRQEIEETKAAPSDDGESALVSTLNPGNYTAIVSGKNGTTGVGLVEVFDLP